MKPYFTQDGISIFHAPCAEVAAQLTPGSVDLVIADPPYGDTSLDWDKRRSWISSIDCCLSPRASVWVFGSFRMFFESQQEFSGWKLAQEIVWEKHNGSSFHADRFKRVHELAVQFYRGSWADIYKKPVTTLDATARTVRRKQRPPHTGHIEAGSYTSEDGGPRLMRSVIYARSCHGYAQHPTQKPEDIVDPLVEYSGCSGGLLFSPFMGSGTDLIVARRRGMFAVGCEVNEAYCEVAAKRLMTADTEATPQ